MDKPSPTLLAARQRSLDGAAPLSSYKATAWFARSYDHWFYLTVTHDYSGEDVTGKNGWAFFEDPYALAILAAATASGKPVLVSLADHQANGVNDPGTWARTGAVELFTQFYGVDDPPGSK